jgi:hypothetical protein
MAFGSQRMGCDKIASLQLSANGGRLAAAIAWKARRCRNEPFKIGELSTPLRNSAEKLSDKPRYFRFVQFTESDASAKRMATMRVPNVCGGPQSLLGILLYTPNA